MYSHVFKYKSTKKNAKHVINIQEHLYKFIGFIDSIEY